MTVFSLPRTLTAGTPENINDVQENFVAVRDHINGNLDATNLAISAKPSNLLAPWKTIAQSAGAIAGGITAGDYYYSTTSLSKFGGANPNAPETVPLDTADFVVAGLTAKARIISSWVVNSTAPNVNFFPGLYGITTSSGANGFTLVVNTGAPFPGSTIGVANPAGGTNGRIASGVFDMPLGVWMLGVNLSGTVAANSFVAVSSRLEVHWE